MIVLEKCVYIPGGYRKNFKYPVESYAVITLFYNAHKKVEVTLLKFSSRFFCVILGENFIVIRERYHGKTK